MMAQEAIDALRCYTLARRDTSFIQQHVVDAFAAQRADERTKPIGLAFALIGLHLHIERKFSESEVQRAHQRLARRRRNWPSFALPRNRGSITAVDVMAFPEGSERDRAIHAWCASVWEAYRESHAAVADLLRDCEVFPRRRD